LIANLTLGRAEKFGIGNIAVIAPYIRASAANASVVAYKAMQNPDVIAFFTNPAHRWKAICGKEGCPIHGIKDPDMTNAVMKIKFGTGINAMFGVCNFMKIYKKSSSTDNTNQLNTQLLKDAC